MRYVSRSAKLRLIVKPTRVDRTNSGENIKPGEDIQFVNGVFDTDKKKEINFIENHPRFNVNIFRQKTKKEQEDELIAKAKEVEKERKAEKVNEDELIAKAK